VAAWQKAHRGLVNSSSNRRRKLWRKEHPDEVKRQDHDRYQRNSEKQRRWSRIWYRTHPEMVKRQREKWYANHQDECRDRNARRRAEKKAVTVEVFTRAEIFERDKGRCHLCGRKVKPNNWHLDHLLPLSKDGKHSKDNVAVSCSQCNLKKHNMGQSQLRLIG